jgi:hypothetical protein
MLYPVKIASNICIIPQIRILSAEDLIFYSHDLSVSTLQLGCFFKMLLSCRLAVLYTN